MELARRLGVWANPALSVSAQSDRAAAAAVLGSRAAEPRPFEPETLRWAVAERAAAARSITPRSRRSAATSATTRAARGACSSPAASPTSSTSTRSTARRWCSAGRRGGGDRLAGGAVARARRAPTAAEHAAARARALLAALAAGRRRARRFPAAHQPLRPLDVASALRADPRRAGAQRRAAPVRAQPVARILGRRCARVATRSARWRGASRARRRTNATQPRASLDAGEEGHPLLASLGRVGRDFQHVLESAADYQDDGAIATSIPGSGSHARGAAVRHSRRCARAARARRQRRSCSRPATTRSPCTRATAPMREVEVLHDQLLALFDAIRPSSRTTSW